jgi:hypothetical protein
VERITWSETPSGRKFASITKATRGALGFRRFIWVVGLLSRNERSSVALGLLLAFILTVIFTSALLLNSVATSTICSHHLYSLGSISFSCRILGTISSMSKHRMPTFHTSAAVVCGCSSYISGGMYRKDPERSVLGGPGREAKRKSARTKCCLSLHRMFSGSMLRWTMPLLWRNSNALSTWISTVL